MESSVFCLQSAFNHFLVGFHVYFLWKDPVIACRLSSAN